MENRLQTMSKVFYDDEILFKDDNSDIHLKMGVRRKFFDKTDEDLTSEEYINYDALKVTRDKEYSKNDADYNYDADQVDDWLTE